ncbi:ABC transporter ATP-binding protein [Chelatococcus reniformis]|uniref:Macrolide export ATP-binding/permease protein MacB n=1 Tax=Chelatococcus reniformis TaxID=1494448 RepID=A0A916UG91_9HYPH|nr:ABC transporter ATP-binding protein [Chelatococcus reniformis]GGC71385.1 macrolide export ATP-binding/permease protein MacB [Chelatococcus reniformis]
MLSCRSVHKVYATDRGPVDAVRGVDLEVAAGRYAALIGRSGSGKSSLMAMVGGLARPTSGTILVDGIDIWSLGDSAMARFRSRRIGYVFQFQSLLPTLRAIDNVALPALLDRSRSRGDVYPRALELLREVGLGDHHDAFPSEMSAGEQRRTVIARALINEPALLLADEPTADLDEQTEREILALLTGVNRDRSTTLVLVTHNLALAGAAEQVVHIADGAVVP